MQNYASILAEHRVRVNIVHPTGVLTPMIANPLSDEFRQDKAEADLSVLINAIPGVPAIDPSDVTSLILFLCSDEARYLTGLCHPGSTPAPHCANSRGAALVLAGGSAEDQGPRPPVGVGVTRTAWS